MNALLDQVIVRDIAGQHQLDGILCQLSPLIKPLLNGCLGVVKDPARVHVEWFRWRKKWWWR